MKNPRPGSVDPESLTVRQLRGLIALDEERHFGRAADRLGTTQPSLSQMIGRLEDTVGAALFTRRPAIRPTHAGRRFLPEVNEALRHLERGLDEVRRAREGHTGRLVVSYASSAMVSPFPAILRAFRQKYPDVRVQLRRGSSASIPGSLEPDEHIGVARLRDPPEDLRAEVIIDEPFVVALPSDHALASRTRVEPGSLAGERIVHFPRAESPELHDDLVRTYLGAGVEPEVGLEAEEWIMVVGLVAAGLGIALVPASFADITWRGVVYRPISPAAPRSVVVVCHPSTAEAPVVREFMRALEDGRGGKRSPIPIP